MATGPENPSSQSNPLKNFGSELASLHLRQNADRADGVEKGMLAGDQQVVKDALAGVKQLLRESATLKERYDQAVAAIESDLGYLPEIRLGSLTSFGLEPAISSAGELTHQTLPALAEAAQQVDHIELDDQPIVSDIAVNEPLLGFSVTEVDHRSVDLSSETVVVPAVESLDDQPLVELGSLPVLASIDEVAIQSEISAQVPEGILAVKPTSEELTEVVSEPVIEALQTELLEVSPVVEMVAAAVSEGTDLPVEQEEILVANTAAEAAQEVSVISSEVAQTAESVAFIEPELSDLTDATSSSSIEVSGSAPTVISSEIPVDVSSTDGSQVEKASLATELELTGLKGKLVDIIQDHGPLATEALIAYLWPDEVGVISQKTLIQRAYGLLNLVRPILEKVGRPVQKNTDPDTKKATYYFDKPVVTGPEVEDVGPSPVEDSSAQLSTAPEQLVQGVQTLIEESVVTETAIPVAVTEKSNLTLESDQTEKIAAPFIPEISNPQQKVLDGYWSTVIEGSKSDLEAALEIYASDVGQVDDAQLVRRLGVYRSTMKPALAKLGITFVKTPIPGSRSGTYSLELTTQAKKKYAKEIKQAEEALRKPPVMDEKPQTDQAIVASSETVEVVEQSSPIIRDISAETVTAESVLSPAPEVLMGSPVVAVAEKIQPEEKSLVPEVGSGEAEVVSPVDEAAENAPDAGETFPTTGEIQFSKDSSEPQASAEVGSTVEEVDKLASQIDTSDIWNFLNFVSDLTSQDVEMLARVGIKIPKSFDSIHFFTKNNKQFGNQLAKTTFERNLATWELKMVSLSRNFKDVMLKHANNQEVQIALFAIHGMIKNEDQMTAALSRRITR